MRSLTKIQDSFTTITITTLKAGAAILLCTKSHGTSLNVALIDDPPCTINHNANQGNKLTDPQRPYTAAKKDTEPLQATTTNITRMCKSDVIYYY